MHHQVITMDLPVKSCWRCGRSYTAAEWQRCAYVDFDPPGHEWRRCAGCDERIDVDYMALAQIETTTYAHDYAQHFPQSDRPDQARRRALELDTTDVTEPWVMPHATIRALRLGPADLPRGQVHPDELTDPARDTEPSPSADGRPSSAELRLRSLVLRHGGRGSPSARRLLDAAMAAAASVAGDSGAASGVPLAKIATMLAADPSTSGRAAALSRIGGDCTLDDLRRAVASEGATRS